jgi:hypothetical protein
MCVSPLHEPCSSSRRDLLALILNPCFAAPTQPPAPTAPAGLSLRPAPSLPLPLRCYSELELTEPRRDERNGPSAQS